MKKKVAKKTARRAPATRVSATRAPAVAIQQIISYERLNNGTTIITALGKDSKVYTWRGLEPCGWALSEFSEADLTQSIAANTPKEVKVNTPVELNRAARRAAAANAPKTAAGGSAFEE